MRNALSLSLTGCVRACFMLARVRTIEIVVYDLYGAHTLFTGQREKEKEREMGREIEREREMYNMSRLQNCYFYFYGCLGTF
jgi:hypothetical protein